MFETGLSDFHKMAVSGFKSHFPKQKPNIASYRSYKRLRSNSYRTEVDNEWLNFDLYNIKCQHFLNIFGGILNKHAPIKKRYIRANQRSLMTRELSKTVVKKSKLRHRPLKEKSEVSGKGCTTQRNYCVNLLTKTKREYFANIGNIF